MKFVEIKPSERLRPFVQCFWWMELDCGNEQEEFCERVLPDGSSEIIFHFGENVSRINPENLVLSEPDCLFIGQNTQTYQITAQGLVRMLGIKFHPHTSSFLLQEKAAQFSDTIVDLQDIFGHSIKDLYQQIGEAKNPGSGIKEAENFLNHHFQNEKSLSLAYLDFAVCRIIENKGHTNLSEIIRKLGITPRYLEKLFLEYVGLSPKTFIQIIQFQEAVRLLTASPKMSLIDISYASGYYDQSHFNRSIKRFTDLTPSQLRQEKMPMQQPFFDSIQT